ncbi:hypothetical protein BDFB_013037 [Asbolus verrucosus]|uniref:C2H2-type domain-containing protein n=1 Tax=Asbolus verrucosus TaxID=1661398 RepID=A0A482V7W7_ASBVE|nr:hypothetical protein BDFB_013037 [Asbolus verrucosus]
MNSYEKVYPTAEELCKVNKNLSCPECSAIFNSDSNLNLHLAKTHKKAHLLQRNNDNKIYHCPVVNCSYNSSAHFKQYKFLKQHYLKVHSEKNYICSLCKKGFSTEAFRNRHFEYCNVIFKCCDCDVFYSCYETLKTHGRRKKHKILEKIAYKTSAVNTILKNPKSDASLSSNKVRLLLPKPSNSMGMIVISDTSEQSSQTYTECVEQNSQETQTHLITKIPQLFTVETQTIGDYFTRKSESVNALKSTKTQTCTPDPKTVSCNTTFMLDDFELGFNNVQRNSSSTQTAIYNESVHIYSSSTSTHDSIHTDTSDLLTDMFDSNFFNCNMETQTDFMFNDELFKYCDDYINMCTQTCDDLLLGEIGPNNMHTQTLDVLKSVESQTIMSQSKRIPLSCKDMGHMETQTDMHFKQMLEEINA